MNIKEKESSSLADRLEKCYSGAVYDVLRAMGYPNQTLSKTIRPLDISSKLSGQIYTVSGRYDESLEPHHTLLQWTGLLSKAPENSVVICQPNDHTLAHMGELSAETMQLRKIRGYIVDGGCRDSEFISKIGFKVFCKYYTPIDVVGRWAPESFEKPIKIDGVIINSGDYVLADRDGVIIIPKELAKEVIEKTEEVLQTEYLVRTAILNGVDPQEARVGEEVRAVVQRDRLERECAVVAAEPLQREHVLDLRLALQADEHVVAEHQVLTNLDNIATKAIVLGAHARAAQHS